MVEQRIRCWKRRKRSRSHVRGHEAVERVRKEQVDLECVNEIDGPRLSNAHFYGARI